MTDTMTPAERGAAIAQGKPADRLPCNPNVANGVARVYGCKISEFNHDAKTLAAAQPSSTMTRRLSPRRRWPLTGGSATTA